MALKNKLQERIPILIRGYISNAVNIWIPDSIVDVIFMFHGIFDISFKSDILNDDDKADLMELICNQLNDDIILKRLYSGKNNGFLSKTFHELCDNKGPTISY